MALESGLNSCPCVKKACMRQGKCEACIANHLLKPTNPFAWCKREENKALLEEMRKAEKR